LPPYKKAAVKNRRYKRLPTTKKPKLLDPMVARVIEFIAVQAATGKRIGRHELEDFAHELGMIRSELRSARDKALKLKLLKEVQLPPAERRGRRTKYLSPAGRKGRLVHSAASGPGSAESSVSAAQSSAPDKQAVSTELLTAALALVKSHAAEIAAIEAEQKAKAELEQIRSSAPGPSSPPPQPETPRPTSPSLWATLGQSIDEFNRGKPAEQDWGAERARIARLHPLVRRS
jgi:hypothetical protein